MFKRCLALLLALVMLVCLAACGNKSSDDEEQTKKSRKTKHTEKTTVSTTTTAEKQESNKTENKVDNKVEQDADNNVGGTENKNDRPQIDIPVQDSNQIDAFAGINYTVTGISPYCQIAVNNGGCSVEAQKYVTYTLDKEHYANGETAVVTAVLSNNTDGEEYTLKETTATYVVADQPEYITSMDGLDFTFFNAELEGYITAKTSEAVGNWGLFGEHARGNSYSTYKSIDKVEQKEIYLTSIKKIKEDTDIKYYNSLNFVLAVDATMHGGSIKEEACTVYVNVIAYNVVKYPDGSLKWGQKDPDSYEFVYKATTESVNYIVTTSVSVQSADYNITKVE